MLPCHTNRTGFHIIFYGVSLATGLYAAHVFIPPTPGPLAAAAILNVPLSDLLKYGFLVAIPVSFVGFVFASFFKSNTAVSQDNISVSIVESPIAANDQVLKNTWSSFLPILVPIVLIGVASFFKIKGCLENSYREEEECTDGFNENCELLHRTATVELGN